MYHLVLDLEMCQVPKKYRSKEYHYALETIQLGAVLLDDNFNQVDAFSSYVHPTYGYIDRFIKDFTGITNDEVKEAKELEEVLIDFLCWIDDREYKVYAWSESDYSQFKHEIMCKNIEGDYIDDFMNLDRWVDYQKIFDDRYGYEKAVSLENALILCDIDSEGRMHDGLDDAINTSRLIGILETNPEYQLTDYISVEEPEPLMICLGDMFSVLSLQMA